MATKWTSPAWRMPENSNQSKFENYSLSFPGINTNQFRLPSTWITDLGLSGATKASVSVWFKPNSTSEMDVIDSYYSNNTNKNLTIKINHPSYPGSLIVYNSTNNTFFNSSSVITVNQWHHVVIVWDASESTAATKTKAYLNGSLLTNTSSTSFTSIVNKDKLLDVSGYLKPFDGETGQLSIFDYALSETQVKYLYNNNAGGSTPNPQNPMAISGPTPVAYYSLGGSSTGSSSTLTIPNESGSGDTVFNFEGPNANEQYINIPFAPNGYTKFTVSQWLNTPSFNARSALFATYGNSANDFQAFFNTTSSGYLFIYVGGAYALSINQFANWGLEDKWFHLTLVYDGTFINSNAATQNAGRLKMYVNGSYEAFNHPGSGTIPSSIPTGNTGMYIGTNTPISYEYGGKMSNVQMWDTSLSDTEITTLYNGGRPYTGTQPQAANLKGWWKMNVDTSVYDNTNTRWVIEDSSTPYNGTINFQI